MAVDAHHLNLFPPQFCSNREIMNPVFGTGNFYNNNQIYAAATAGGGGGESTLEQMYSSVINDSVVLPNSAMKSDSGLTYNLPMSRKRSRDSVNPFFSSSSSYNQTPQIQKSSAPFSFLGEDLSLQIQRQQFDIDRLISQHMENVRVEIEEKRKRQARRIMEAVEIGMIKRLRAKEEEIEKIGKMNLALEERVKSLCIENQIWRNLAQTNEATVNALRSNLEQVLSQIKDERTHGGGVTDAAAAVQDDAQSYCGSSVGDGGEPEGRRPIAGEGEEVKENGGNKRRWCKNCGEEESCVLLLPCRHLCLCTACGSHLHTCPMCKCTKNASVHVNMS